MSANELEHRWKCCSWYHKLSGAPGESGESPHHRDDLNLRLRRVLSWLGRAEEDYKAQDYDAAFIFYWIAFNAMYEQLGSSSVDDTYEKDKRRDYFGRVVAVSDSESVIYATISGSSTPIAAATWPVLRDEIERVLENRFVYAPYWKNRNNPTEARDWEQRFKRDRKRALQALSEKRIDDVLCELFHRLNTLRNQLLHGGATWKSSVNRNQVEPGARIMWFLVPHFIVVMIDHHDAGWGNPRYPVVRESGPQSGWPGGE